MDAVTLEKAPKIAIYTPPKAPPWDDAVTLALRYAGIEYTTVWDDDVMNGDLTKYDWLHLFHEDFTGQLNKLYLGFRDAPWFVEQRERNLDAAKRLGFASIPALKKGVAERIRQYVEAGGFLFAMCGATETLELAIAAQNADIAAAYRGWIADRRGRGRAHGLEARDGIQRRARRAVTVHELNERYRWTSGERARASPTAWTIHAVRVFGQVRSRRDDAGSGSSDRDS